jgi:hypothetical protein
MTIQRLTFSTLAAGAPALVPEAALLWHAGCSADCGACCGAPVATVDAGWEPFA